MLIIAEKMEVDADVFFCIASPVMENWNGEPRIKWLCFLLQKRFSAKLGKGGNAQKLGALISEILAHFIRSLLTVYWFLTEIY